MPKLADIYIRRRLFDWLDHAKQKKVVWISAPAGSGKTALIASYIRTSGLPYLWYQVDEGDNDIASFVYFMGQQRIIPQKSRLPLLTNEYLGNVVFFIRNYFRYLFKAVDVPCFLVFDNYQDVDENSLLNNLFPTALEETPRGVSIVFISRSAPPASFSRLRANGEVSLLDAGQIQFTAAESLALGHLRAPGEFGEQQLMSIHRIAQGWVAGQILLLEQIKHTGHIPDVRSSNDLQVIFDYFAAEVFNRSGTDIQNVLLKTAFLKKFTPLEAEQLTGLPHTGSILDALNRGNLFTAKHFSPHLMYEYHPLFRAFLVEKLQNTFAPEYIADLRGAAAGVLARAGHINDAVGLLLAAKRWDESVAIILRHARRYVEQGRGLTVKTWLSGIPETDVQKTPWCLYWLGVCQIPMDFATGRRHLENAYALFNKADDFTGMCLAWTGIVESYVIQWGDFSPLDRWIQEMDEATSRYTQFPSPEIEIRVVAGFFSATIYRCPDHPKRDLWIAKLEQYLAQSNDSFLGTQIANLLILYYSWCNLNLSKAADLIAQLERTSGDELAPFISISRHAIHAVYRWNAGENQLCEENARKGLAIAEETGIQVWDFMLHAQITWARLSSDDVEGAEQNLDVMAGLLDRRRFLDASHYHYQRFVVAFHKEDNRSMQEHGQSAFDYANKAGSPWAMALTLTAVGQAHYANGNLPQASDCVARVRDYGKSIRSSNTLFQALMQEAEMELDSPQEKTSNQKLKTVLAFCREHALVNWPWWCRRVISRLLVRALENDIEVAYVRQLIRKRSFIPETIPVDLENWPWTYRIYTLGRFNLLIDDQPLKFAGKAQKRPLDLLKALIALGGREVSVNQLMDCLWPEAEADAAHASFNMALKRLRKLLGDHRVLQLSEGMLTLDPSFCWVDAWAFERTAGETTVDPEKVEKALALYHGPLFDNEIDCIWFVLMRQRLHRKFLTLVMELGCYREERQQWQKAVDCYLKGVAIDGLAEAFYQRLMVCYKTMGLTIEAKRIFQQYLELLAHDPNMRPSKATLDIFNSL